MDKKVKKSIELNNSLKFNFHLSLKEGSFDLFLNNFLNSNNLKRIHLNKYKNNISVLMANLYLSYKQEKFLVISLSKNFYVLSKEYNPKYLRWDILEKVITYLKTNNYIDIYKGYKQGNVTRLTRIKFNKNFFENEKIDWDDTIQTDFENYSYVILKDDNKKLIKFNETPLVKRRTKVIKDFNLVLNENYITYKNRFLSCTPMYRVFNNKSFKQGGRFYGGEFQRLSKKERKFIKINGKDIVELDYSCLHINLLYDKEKIKYKKDAYEIGYKSEHSRKMIKFILITILNSSSRKDAISAVRYNFNRSGVKSKINIEKIIDLLLEKHKRIEKYFFNKENGLRLQYQESLLAEYIIKNFIYGKKRKVILPIHDGFICEKKYEKKLRRVMIQAYKKFIGNNNYKITKI